MNREQFLQTVLPHLGGPENVSRQSWKGNKLCVTVKDVGVLQLDALRAADPVAAAELDRARVTVTAQGIEFEEENIMATDNKQIAKTVLAAVGGKDNVTQVTHCMTRLRFSLKDLTIPDIEKMKQIQGVISVIKNTSQIQVVIGHTVDEVYEEVLKLGNFSGGVVNENLDGELAKKEPFSIKKLGGSIVDSIVGCIVPILPILIGSGLIKALLLILQNIGLLSAESPTSVTLTFVADAAFYFMPVFIGGFAAKKFGGNTALGAMLGAVLLHPTFVSLVGEGAAISVFGLPVYGAAYSSTIVPAILSVWIMCYVEKFISKHSPKMLRSILEPLLTLLIMTPLTLCAIAPIGAMLSDGFAAALTWFYSKLGFIAVAVFCAFIPFVVMVGLHVGTVPIAIQSIASTGSDKLFMPAFFLSNFTQGAACLAVGLRAKDPDTKSLALSSAFSDLVPGVSEPGMYGITLRYKTPMLGAMLGAAAGGLYFGITGVGTYTFAPPNLFAFATYIGEGNNLLNAVIGVMIGIVVSFVATMLLYKEEPATV